MTFIMFLRLINALCKDNVCGQETASCLQEIAEASLSA